MTFKVHLNQYLKCAECRYNGIFKNKSTQEILLKTYVEKGILPELDFMESGEFTEMVANVKRTF
ncbi:MAG: hypothetical protein HRT38_10900 [Alteromonadaceae bacterium]|nr:hypothetical protein [Alteromonadaceae bacterium]